ncbi:MAG: AAA family ATPase [Deltaproteobacteria bacterium]|nr:AAA family ATPase [Deltaproteobacteria bacterium]
MSSSNSLFGSLPYRLEQDLRALNPQWIGKPGPQTPPVRRWAFDSLYHNLRGGLTPATVLRGPRRVGKTILLRQIIESLLADGIPPKYILYVAFDEIGSLEKTDDPILAIARWFENKTLQTTFNESAREGKPAYLFFDEVQNLSNWAPQIKHLVDNHQVRILVTGSSSLRIESGRDSLAGRITTLDLGALQLREIAAIRFGIQTAPFWKGDGLEAVMNSDFWHNAKAHSARESEIRQKAFQAFSERGAYPIAHDRPDIPWPELADHLNETVIKRAIQHDLRMGSRGQKRDEKLLEEVFRLCCRYAGQTPGQSVFVPEIQQALSANLGWARILNYLRFLDGSLLIKLVQPLELRLKRRKSPPKICLCDHSLRASWLQEVVPMDSLGLAQNPHLTDLAGHLAESIMGYFMGSIPGLDIAYFPARKIEPEVDFVITVGTRRIPVEVKYRRRIDPFEDTRSLRAFLEKTVYNAPLGLLITLEDDVVIPDPRIVPISLSSFLWLR